MIKKNEGNNTEVKLIVGLGNPGKQYEKTRHNLGFIMLDQYVEEKKLDDYKSKFNGLYTVEVKDNEKIIYLKPQSYMNLSGGVVQKYMKFFKIPASNLFVLCDDLDQPNGKYKLKATGSSGGHNGLKDIELVLGTKDYKRLKLGISSNKQIDTKDYVLGKFSKEETKNNDEVSKTIMSIIEDFPKLDFQKLMNKYNGK